MLTRVQIKEILKDSPLKVLLSEEEIESFVEELYQRYSEVGDSSKFYKKEELCPNL